MVVSVEAGSINTLGVSPDGRRFLMLKAATDGAGESKQLVVIPAAMNPNLSIDREAVPTFCRRHHITRLVLFRSVLRADFGSESDVDVLVGFQTG
jgi:hypothetical protein